MHFLTANRLEVSETISPTEIKLNAFFILFYFKFDIVNETCKNRA